MNEEPTYRLTPTLPLPPYSYVPGHDLPHPVNDPSGHSFNTQHAPHIFTELPTDPTSRRHALAALLATNSHWLYALDLFNTGYYWEAHEAWEHFWNAFGRTRPEARCGSCSHDFLVAFSCAPPQSANSLLSERKCSMMALVVEKCWF